MTTHIAAALLLPFFCGKTVNVYAVIPKQGNLINDGLIWLACIHIDGDDFSYAISYNTSTLAKCTFSAGLEKW